jgi:precorrin-3B C17-methyltransferase
MTGRLDLVGLGPGRAGLMTPEVSAVLGRASAIYGYGPYLDRVTPREGQSRHASDNRDELDRARAALVAAETAPAAMVSGGDPGVFAMAAAVCEAVEQGPDSWRAIEITVHPGITAMLALAARVGAPLGHDFCAISISDNLKPWPVVERRLAAAAQAGFAMALYNPISRARPWQLGAGLDILRRLLPAGTPVIFGRAVAREDEAIRITTLAEADPADADMATCILIGTAETRVIPRPSLPPLVYTPRRAPV